MPNRGRRPALEAESEAFVVLLVGDGVAPDGVAAAVDGDVHEWRVAACRRGSATPPRATWITSPGSSTWPASPRLRTRPRPVTAYRNWPPECWCQCVLAPGGEMDDPDVRAVVGHAAFPAATPRR